MRLVAVRLSVPLLSKVPVNTVVHRFKARLVEPSSVYCPPGVPFVAFRVSVVPLTLMLVKCGRPLTTLLSVFSVKSDESAYATPASPDNVTPVFSVKSDESA